MKRLQFLLIFTFALGMANVYGQSQQPGLNQQTFESKKPDKTGEITSKGAIQIKEAQEIGGYYNIDTSVLGFEDVTEATAYFRTKSGKHHMMRALSRDRAIVYIKKNDQPSWNTNQWNKYLAQTVKINLSDFSPQGE
ncbi:MAG: hypothetical protein ABR572_12660 [Cryomorphaceae bacterium]|nr:hypothetical protein [Flavobacteriales bacterium]